MNLLKSNRSLKDHFTMTWVVSGVLAFLTCTIAIIVMGWIDYHNIEARFVDDLLSKSVTVSRRLSGELLLGNSGAAASVATNLQNELKIENIHISKGAPCNEKPTETDHCIVKNYVKISVLRVIPHLQDPMFVEISNPKPPFFTFDRFFLFFLSVIPIVLVLVIALCLQRYFMNKYVLKPINALVDTSTGIKNPENHWPNEIKDIAGELAKSFEDREQSVYGQIARGVIHDIRTLLHSIFSATQLVKEQDIGTPKRLAMLETLFKASDTNLPKINDLINLTLDGSREVPINSKLSDMTTTIKNAISTNEALGIAKNVTIRMGVCPDKVLVIHDSLQLERVFTNLIKNGIEACEEQKMQDGTVQVSVDLDRINNEVSIAVEDSGAGISDSPSNIFRLLKSTKVHGSGLGLVVSRKIVQAHGGTLVPKKSSLLGGARFEVRLPTRESENCT